MPEQVVDNYDISSSTGHRTDNMINKSSKVKKKGQAMVEFALVFPLLLLLTVGVIEVGRILFSYSAIIAAAREGARYGAATQNIGGIPQYEDCEGIRAAVKRIGRFAGISDENITIRYSNEVGVYASSCPPAQSVSLGDRIVVTANTIISPLVSFVNIPPIPVTSTAAKTILKEVEIGETGLGANSPFGSSSDVNFVSTSQTAEETRGTISVDVFLTEPQIDPVSVPFTLAGTAEKGSYKDYTITSSPLTIPAGEQIATIYINLNNDGVAEGEETLVIELQTPTNATLGSQNRHTVIIVDPPQVSFSTTSNTEPEDTGEVVVMVELSKRSTQDITVEFSPSGTAEWGLTKDYTTSSSPLTIPAGTLTTSLTITVNEDFIDEHDESAILTLANPTNALLGDDIVHALTITDNDPPPSVSFYTDTLIVSEEVGSLTTSVELSSISGKDVTVPFSIEHVTTTSGDFTITTPSPLTVLAGNKTAIIQIDITEGDGLEEDESFNLALETPTNAEIGSISTQTITITESAGNLPVISFSQATQTISEDNIDLITIGVEMDHAWKDTVTVHYTVSGTASEGVSGDYAISPSPLFILKGKPRGEIEVQLNNDIITEDEETIIVTIETVVNGTSGTPKVHTITITDDDLPPSVSFLTPSQKVLETAGSDTVLINLSGPSSHTVTIPLSFSGTATGGSDYTVPSSEITIPPGSTSETFTIGILDDSEYDPDETIILSMGVPTNATKGVITEHTITIEDDELPYCATERYLLTVNLDSITWSINNNGESVTFTGGSITWPEESISKPRLKTITFGGAEVFSGNESPGTLSYKASESFPETSTEDLVFQFASVLGSGDHTITINFENTSRGETCSITHAYNKP